MTGWSSSGPIFAGCESFFLMLKTEPIFTVCGKLFRALKVFKTEFRQNNGRKIFCRFKFVYFVFDIVQYLWFFLFCFTNAN